MSGSQDDFGQKSFGFGTTLLHQFPPTNGWADGNALLELEEYLRHFVSANQGTFVGCSPVLLQLAAQRGDASQPLRVGHGTATPYASHFSSYPHWSKPGRLQVRQEFQRAYSLCLELVLRAAMSRSLKPTRS